MYRDTFKSYLDENNREGSGKANSYLKALDLLSDMLRIEPYSFQDCVDVWSVNSAERLLELREFVRQEQKKNHSLWKDDSIPASYLDNGYCSAALSQFIEFLPRHHFAEWTLKTMDIHQGNDEDLKNALNTGPKYSDAVIDALSALEGRDSRREVKSRIGQWAFRKMILKIYQNRCCITGIDIPTVNRASHIISWAKRKDTRMDPRNGICLSATYDAAFDNHLISFDQDFRLLISKDISDHFTSDSVNAHFMKREGQIMELPQKFFPKKEYLEEHRQTGNF